MVYYSSSMKANIHPNWHHDCVVTCSCGNTLMIGSVVPSLQVDICSKCHPFFTGEVKFVDRQGRLELFKKKLAVAATYQTNKQSLKKSSAPTEPPKTYRELLREQQGSVRGGSKSKTAKDAAAESPVVAKTN